MPRWWGCTYSNIFGFSILACRSSFIRFFFCFSCIGLTLFKNNCSNETFVSFASIRLSFQPFGNQQNPSRALSYYLIIRLLLPYQSSYFTNLQVALNFSDKLHILSTNNIVKSPMLVLNNSKIWYKDTIQVCFTSL